MHHAEDWAEDLTDIGGHLGAHVADDGGADKVAIGIFVHGYIPTVEKELGALVHGCLDQVLNPLLGGG